MEHEWEGIGLTIITVGAKSCPGLLAFKRLLVKKLQTVRTLLKTRKNMKENGKLYNMQLCKESFSEESSSFKVLKSIAPENMVVEIHKCTFDHAQ